MSYIHVRVYDGLPHISGLEKDFFRYNFIETYKYDVLILRTSGGIKLGHGTDINAFKEVARVQYVSISIMGYLPSQSVKNIKSVRFASLCFWRSC